MTKYADSFYDLETMTASGTTYSDWFDVQAIARTNENAETKKSALETLEEDKKVSYIIIQTKRIVKVESEESNDEIPF